MSMALMLLASATDWAVCRAFLEFFLVAPRGISDSLLRCQVPFERAVAGEYGMVANSKVLLATETGEGISWPRRLNIERLRLLRCFDDKSFVAIFITGYT
jgi:hypothetical protein